MNDKTPNEVTPPYAESTAPVARLALRPKEAARALGIGTRLLWQETRCGNIPHLRIGRAVVYPVEALRQYLSGKNGQGT